MSVSIKSNTVVAGSIGELVSFVKAEMTRHPEVHWFRGQRDSEWPVIPSVWRNYDREEERNLTNRFRARASIRVADPPGYDACAEWLSMMQHYGLPTRLLDWSRSPLVAAYFALEDLISSPAEPRSSAAVWMLRPHTLNLIEGHGGYTPSVNAHMCEKLLLPAFKSEPDSETVMAVMASETDFRMVIQQGCFTIHSRQTPLDQTENSSKFLTRVVIPQTTALEFAAEMKCAGFRKGDIFPDLTNLAAELKDSYGRAFTARRP